MVINARYLRDHVMYHIHHVMYHLISDLCFAILCDVLDYIHSSTCTITVVGTCAKQVYHWLGFNDLCPLRTQYACTTE